MKRHEVRFFQLLKHTENAKAPSSSIIEARPEAFVQNDCNAGSKRNII
jgi:hypothetical protein